MLRHLSVRRSLAGTAVIAVSILSTGALPATADQGGNGRGAEHSTVKKDKDEKHDKAPGKDKGDQDDTAKGGKPDKAQGKPEKAPKPAKPAPTEGQGKADKGDRPSTGKGGDKADQGGGKDRVPGNNGTVKITPLGETDGTPNNHPHVGCAFQIEWYGYDKGDDIVSQVGFAMHAPTSDVGLSVSGPSSVFVGGDAASGAGTATGLDGREVYTLSFDGAGHPKQGYHVKVTVTTPYSQGNDTKTKVFWVRGCDETEVPPTEEPPTEEPPTEEPPTEEPPAEEPPVIVMPPEPVNPPDSPESPDTPILSSSPGFPPLINRGPGTPPQSGQPADVPTVVEAGLRNDADTTGSSAPLILVGLGAGLAGAALVSRRRQLAAAARRR